MTGAELEPPHFAQPRQFLQFKSCASSVNQNSTNPKKELVANKELLGTVPGDD